jgi:hypothetical protein
MQLDLLGWERPPELRQGESAPSPKVVNRPAIRWLERGEQQIWIAAAPIRENLESGNHSLYEHERVIRCEQAAQIDLLEGS